MAQKLSKYHKQKIFEVLPKFRQAVKSFTNSHLSANLDCHKRKDLKCSCAISSHAMGTLLEKMGYSPTIVFGVYDENDTKPTDWIDINHCWIELGDHIIDVTATQFGVEEEILFDEVEKFNSKFFPIIRTTVSSAKADMRKYMSNDISEWQKRQTPSLRNTKHILRAYQDLTGENLGV